MTIALDNIELPTKDHSKITARLEQSKDKLKMSQETYFKILMAQFKYQDPTQPMRPEAIAEQMMSMGQVEQMITLNEQMSKLTALQEESKLNNAVSFIGKSIIDDGAQQELAIDEYNDKPAPLEFKFHADEDKYGLKFTIVDSHGRVIKRESEGIFVHQGTNKYVWDGYSDDGEMAPEGIYFMRMSNKKNFSALAQAPRSGANAEFKFFSSQAYPSGEYIVKDVSGKQVAKGKMTIEPGENILNWRAVQKTGDGEEKELPAGRYFLEVETGETVGIKTKFARQITGILPEGQSGKIEVILDDNSTKTLSEVTNLFATMQQEQ